MIKSLLVVAFFAVGVVVQCQDEPMYKKTLSKMCQKNGAREDREDVENSLQSFVDCFYGLFEPEEEDVRRSVAFDVNKHCAKSEELKVCLRALTYGLAPCMDHSFFDYAISNGSVDLLLNYICFKEGDKFGLFFPDGGPECFQEKILSCALRQTQVAPTSRAAVVLSVNVPCGNFNELSACVVTAMAECSRTKRPGSYPSPCCPNSASNCPAILTA